MSRSLKVDTNTFSVNEKGVLTIPDVNIFRFDTVEKMLLASKAHKIGQMLETLGRNKKGDGGGAKYLVVKDGTYIDGKDGHFVGYDYFQGETHQFSLIHNGIVFPEQFGWVGDWNGKTGTDNTKAINNMIEYCSPYNVVKDALNSEKKNVYKTRKTIGKIRAKIVGGMGIARVTDSIRINPFIRWEGIKKGGFYDSNGGSTIIADFDDKKKYIADTAPILADGSRPLGATYRAADYDDGVTPGSKGWHLTNVHFQVASGRVVKGAFNRQVAQQSKLEDCSFGSGGGDCYEGIKSSVCWGGVLTGNHIYARAYALRNEYDITVDYQTNNYLTVTGNKPSADDYEYIKWVDDSLQNMSACIVNVYSEPYLCNNICEKAEIGLQAAREGNSVIDEGNYYEAITKYVYGLHTVNASLRPIQVLAPKAKLLYVQGGTGIGVDLDLQTCSFLSTNGWGNIGSETNRVIVSGMSKIVAFPYNKKVTYKDIAINGMISIYVDNNGDDTNSGYSAKYAVKTLQAALERCKPDALNRIHLAKGQTIKTKYKLEKSNVTDSTLSNLAIEIVGANSVILVGQSSNQTHCLPLNNSKCKLSGIEINLSNAATQDNYRSFLRSKGRVDYELDNVTVIGSGGVLFGSQSGVNGQANISMNTVTLDKGVMFTHNSDTKKGFAWIETSNNITNNGVAEGNAFDGKIFSTLF